MDNSKKLIKDMTADSIDQAFVLSAIESYCHMVLQDTSDWGNSLINKDLWQSIAKANLTMLENARGSK
jgi:hypothetical protein